jgi:hypothetical protein
VNTRPKQPDGGRKNHESYSHQLSPADIHANESNHTVRAVAIWNRPRLC